MTKIYDGLRVLELAGINASFCGKLLASFGAEVIKVEPVEGHASRRIGPFAKGVEGPEASLSFAYQNTGKKSMTLDLMCAEGQAIFRRLARTADVILEDWEPGALDALGIGYEALSEDHPELIMCSITPFGQNGPHAKWKASTDLIVDAMGGSMADVGYVGKGPLHLGYDIQAMGASGYGLIAIQAAWHNRLFTGKGTHIDVSQQESVCMWRSQTLGRAQKRPDNMPFFGGEDFVPQGVVTCRDGFANVMIGGKWKELLDWFDDKGIDTSRLKTDAYNIFAEDVLAVWDRHLLDRFNELGAQYTKTEFMEEGQRRRIPVCTLESPDTLLSNRQLLDRGFYVEIDHPVIGRYLYPAYQGRMTASPALSDQPAPLLGAHTDAILTELGYSDLTALHERGVA